VNSTNQRLSFSSIWKTLIDSSTVIPLIALLQQWADSLPQVEIDWIYVNILSKEQPGVSLQQSAVILDILLFRRKGNRIRSVSGVQTILDWMRYVQQGSTIDEKLQWRPLNSPYRPYFVRETESGFPRLVDIFYVLVCKWIAQFHSSISISELLQLISECESCGDREIQNIRKIVLVGLRTFLFQKWVAVVDSKQQDFEVEIVKSSFVTQLELLEPVDGWVMEFAGCLIGLQSKQSDAVEKVMSWSNENNNGNKILETWMTAVQSALSTTIIPKSTPLFSYGSSGADSTLMDISYTWVLPQLTTFYNWISSEIADYSISESVARNLTIGDLIQRSIPQFQNKYLLLWTLVKVGVNSCPFMNLKLDDSLSVCDLITTTDPAGSRYGLLYTAFRNLTACYSKFRRPQSNNRLIKGMNFELLPLITSVNPMQIELELGETCSYELGLQGFQSLSFEASWFGIIQRLTWLDNSEPGSCYKSKYIEYLQSIAPDITETSLKLRYCTFTATQADLKTLSNSRFTQIYHSLEHQEIASLLQACNLLQQQVPASCPSNRRIRDILQELYLNEGEGPLSKRFGISEKEQLSFLLSLSIEDIPRLIGFLNMQLQTESFIFANKPFDLKKPLPELIYQEIDCLEEKVLDNASLVRDLEICLIRNELVISSDPEASLVKTLSRSYQSEEAMFRRVPLLALIQEACQKHNFIIQCGHYILLRLKNRQWTKRVHELQKISLIKKWDWSIKASLAGKRTHQNDLDDSPNLPWFLVDNEEEIIGKPVDTVTSMQEGKANHFAKKIQRLYRMVKAKREALNLARQRAEMNNTDPGGRGRGRGRLAGRGGRGSGRVTTGLIAEAAKSLEKVEQNLKEIETLLSIAAWTKTEVDEIIRLINETIQPGTATTNLTVITKAKERVNMFNEETDSFILGLKQAMIKKPLNRDQLCEKLNQLTARRIETRDVRAAAQLLTELDQLLLKVDEAKQRNSENLPLLMQLQAELIRSYLPPDGKIQSLIDEFQKDSQLLKAGIKKLGFNASCLDLLTIDAFDLSSASAQQATQLQGQFSKIDTKDKAKLSKAIDGLIEKLEKDPLKEWIHCQAVLSLAYSSPSHINYYNHDAKDCIEQYLSPILKNCGKVLPIVLLIFARLSPGTDRDFRIACFRRCNFYPELRNWMTETEKKMLEPPIEKAKEKDAQGSASSISPLHFTTKDPEERWKILQQQPNAIPSPAIEKLMKMIGLTNVKLKILEIYQSIWMESQLPQKSRVPQSFHFALMGNPGTGKTTVGNLLCQMLQELSVRKNANFLETTGEKLARMGADKASKQIAQAADGTLFIDEAYALAPKRSSEGAAIAMQLLDTAEAQRENLTIILAGYKDDIENELFSFNDGFVRRFPFALLFDDYTDDELRKIFESYCKQYDWTCKEEVSRLAARKVGRGRGKGFGNAGAVRVVFETSYRRASMRPNNNQELTTIDVLGPPPLPENIPDLKSALDELDDTIGLDTVKEKIHTIVRLAQNNYQLELEGKEPRTVTLNRVFLGNPGTGKTSVAKLYGRILKGIGLLTDGAWELKQANDFIGSHVGDSQGKTAGIIKRAQGKVLIIDEAYGFYGSSYGADAVNTLVGLVHNAPGENIAVIMIGYEKEMRKMFREMNPGLSRRFPLDEAFTFEDYSDADLDKIAIKNLKESGLAISRDLRRVLIKSISMQRFSPNFGNAGTVVSTIAAAKGRITARDPTATSLTLADLGINQDRSDPLEYLNGMFKTDHIVKELKVLKAVLQQAERDGKEPREFLKNYVFLGNPGTGKTTVARVMANILYSLGMLSRNNVVIRSGLDLQAAYVGQTKDKVNEAMEEARGGVLFIDEAYTLAQANSTIFAKEAVDQLVALMTSPEHLNHTVVILAGYPRPMDQMLRSGNEGLASRFTGRMIFPDWDAQDCIEYLQQQCEQENLVIEARTISFLKQGIEEISHLPGWANARDCLSIKKNLYQARAVRGGRDNVYLIEDAVEALEPLRNSRTNLPAVPIPIPAAIPSDFQSSMLQIFPPPAPPQEQQHQQEILAAREEKEIEDTAEESQLEVHTSIKGMDPIFVALLQACRAAGYDNSHERRQDLVAILDAVEEGEDFPQDIMTIVVQQTQRSELEVTRLLRPQVHIVLEGMRNAVRAEEERREELLRLEEEKRKEKELEMQRTQEKLRMAGVCCMGYSWHRQGAGWRCAGGSHYMSDLHLDQL
jgi:SpoVK/Ycf46/Vps4 family AAA+-type ATPase